jgi:hypothetical protein
MRTFENRAHLRRGLRTFGRAGLALHPVPLTRKVAQTPASASFAFLDKVRFVHAFATRAAG